MSDYKKQVYLNCVSLLISLHWCICFPSLVNYRTVCMSLRLTVSLRGACPHFTCALKWQGYAMVPEATLLCLYDHIGKPCSLLQCLTSGCNWAKQTNQTNQKRSQIWKKASSIPECVSGNGCWGYLQGWCCAMGCLDCGFESWPSLPPIGTLDSSSWEGLETLSELSGTCS